MSDKVLLNKEYGHCKPLCSSEGVILAALRNKACVQAMLCSRHFTERQMDTSKRFTFGRYKHAIGMQWVIRYVGAAGAFQYSRIIPTREMPNAATHVRNIRNAVRSAMKSKQTLLQGASK